MRRSRWVVLLAAVAVAALTARLGWWQLDRAAQKTALHAALETRGGMPPLSAAELAPTPAAAALQTQRRAQLAGRWIDQATVYLDNRTMAGRSGFFVVTPLLLDDGRVLPVQRGWLPRDASDRTRIAPYRTPNERVQLTGHLAAQVSQVYELGQAAPGPIRQNLDLAQLAASLRKPLVPLALVEDATPVNASDGLARDWPAPASDVHKHYGYAFQWFALCALVIVLYVWFQIIRPRRRTG